MLLLVLLPDRLCECLDFDLTAIGAFSTDLFPTDLLLDLDSEISALFSLNYLYGLLREVTSLLKTGSMVLD